MPSTRAADAGPEGLVAIDCSCDAPCTSRPAPTDGERYDECRARPQRRYCSEDDPCPPPTCLRGVRMDWDGGALDECPPVGGRRQYLHVVENECEPPRGDPSVRRVLPDALRCSIDARASVDVQPLRHALESRAWFACFAPPLETSPAAAGKRVRISVALDRTGQASWIGIEGVDDGALLACARDAVARDLQAIAPRMAGSIATGRAEWVLRRP